jgi:hypothetical protein
VKRRVDTVHRLATEVINVQDTNIDADFE